MAVLIAASVTALVTAPADAATTTIDVGTCVDGQDSLVIAGNTLQWIYGNDTPVGSYRGDCPQSATTITTTGHGSHDLTGVQWTPTFPSGPNSTVYTAAGPLLPAGPISSLVLMPEQARVTLTIQQYPTPANHETLILNFNDDAAGGAAYYEGLVTISTVAEPATWTIMIAGFGAVGAVLRGRQTALAMA